VKACLALVGVLAWAGCGVLTDAATRLAYDLKAAEGRLGSAEGDAHTFRHAVPSHPGQCTGPYSVQLDQVGLIVFWCKDTSGKTVSSHSTSYHRRFVDTAKTFLLDKPAGAALEIRLERRQGRAVITSVL